MCYSHWLRNMNRVLCFFAFIFLANPAIAIDHYDDPRFRVLTNEIRCVVCQNQSIADSSAPLANDLREKISLMIQTGKSDDEIKDYLVKRYGEFILLRPRFSLSTLFLWFFPFIGLAAIFYSLFFRKPQANP